MDEDSEDLSEIDVLQSELNKMLEEGNNLVPDKNDDNDEDINEDEDKDEDKERVKNDCLLEKASNSKKGTERTVQMGKDGKTTKIFHRVVRIKIQMKRKNVSDRVIALEEENANLREELSSSNAKCAVLEHELERLKVKAAKQSAEPKRKIAKVAPFRRVE